MYKLIFADIDGTLRNSKREITGRTKDDIKKLHSRGIEVVLCSGRPRCEVERVSRECRASRYIISSNGAELYDYIAKKVIYKDLVNINCIEKLYGIIESTDCTFVMHSGNIRIVNKFKYNDHTEIIPSKGIINAAYENDILQCTIVGKNFETMKEIRQKVQEVNGVKIVNESKCFNDKKIILNDSIYCDVVDKNVSKGFAVAKLCEVLGINRKETIGIGDSYNDLEFLDFVGYSVAMKNSVRGLKSRVDYVTNSNDLDGAAEFFERVLNNEI